MLTGTLTIDLDAVTANWRALDALSAPDCETGAVVKANAYGCGIEQVGPALTRAGCRAFFVATPHEGVRLRAALGADARIHILSGFAADQDATFRAHHLRPILNAPEQVAAWMAGPAGPAMLQIDTGMNRLGMEAAELAALAPLPDGLTHVMSHLACADIPDHPQNAAQFAAFQAMTDGLTIPRSLAATAGILLGPDWHFEMTRPGIGLYGGWPFVPSRPAIGIEVPILQIRDVVEGESVGYGAAWVAQRPSRIATIAAGYADGLIRNMGNSGKGVGFIHNQRAPFAGRVSMDLITLDVTECGIVKPGDPVEIIGPNQTIDDVAAAIGSIGHEVLTSLGDRYHRIHV